jgi:hypothetical protein
MVDRPIEIHVVPNIDESTRVNVRSNFRSPRFIIVGVGILMLSSALVLFAISDVTESPAEYAAAARAFASALAIPVAIFLWARFRIRRQLKASFKENSWGEASINNDAFDIRGPHGSAHLAWTAIKWARRIPEGVLVGIGTGQIFYSRTYFADGDFDRFLALLRVKVGARAKF